MYGVLPPSLHTPRTPSPPLRHSVLYHHIKSPYPLHILVNLQIRHIVNADLPEYVKQMVGSGFDPLPDYDYPLEIEGSGLISVWKTSLPLIIQKAYKYGKPLAQKKGASSPLVRSWQRP